MSNNTTTDAPWSSLVATVNVVLSISLMLVYVPCIYVILKNEKFYKLASYKFIILLAIFDFLSLLTTGPASAVYQLRKETQPTDSKFWGAIGFSTWFGYIIAIGFLSIERFFKICMPGIWDRLYQGYTIYTWLGFPVGYTTAMFIVLMNSDHNGLYDPNAFSWYYKEPPDNGFVQLMDITMGLSMPVFMTIIYINIFIRFYKMNQSTSEGSSKLERQILYQSFWTSTMMAAVVLTFHGVPLISANKWAYWICHLVWLMNSGINGIIYIRFNKSMRDAIMALVKNKPSNKVTFNPKVKSQAWSVGPALM